MSTNDSTPPKPLRLWPGIALAALLLAAYLVPVVSPENAVIGLIAPVAGALFILLWWLLFSRARWYERVGGIVLIALGVFAQKYFVHASLAGGGMGMLSYLLVIPTLTVALVGWAV